MLKTVPISIGPWLDIRLVQYVMGEMARIKHTWSLLAPAWCAERKVASSPCRFSPLFISTQPPAYCCEKPTSPVERYSISNTCTHLAGVLFFEVDSKNEAQCEEDSQKAYPRVHQT